MKDTLLIVDDFEINRTLLTEIFSDSYNIIEASDGLEALNIINQNDNISAVLLDMVMPKMDGLSVLKELNNSGRINDTPVFIITATNEKKLLMDAYDLGAADVVTKPIISQFLKRRVFNIVELYKQRKNLQNEIESKVKQINFKNRRMVEHLANMVEYRSQESGEHVKRVSKITKFVLTEVCKLYPEIRLTQKQISQISFATVLHDVGKIKISDTILNKPGRLTPEEFDIVKTHTLEGCKLLASMHDTMDKQVYQFAYDICRHHHERFDGRGYPDGLLGNEIPIWSQVAGLADVYDALTSPRCYKKEFDHETSVKMILNGECGVFNPKLLRVFESIQQKILLDN